MVVSNQVMDIVWLVTLAACAVFLIVYGIYRHFSKRPSQPTSFPYHISFKNVPIPDLKDSRLADKVAIRLKKEDGYLVASRISDKELKALLKEVYHYDDSQVIVTTGMPALSMA